MLSWSGNDMQKTLHTNIVAKNIDSRLQWFVQVVLSKSPVDGQIFAYNLKSQTERDLPYINNL